MKRVLQVVSSLRKNGTETFIMNLFRNIDRSEVMFDFLVFNDDRSGFYEEIVSYGSRVFFLPPRRKDFFKYKKELISFFEKNASDYDAVHMHGMSLTTLLPLKLAKRYGIKKRIFHIHGSSCQGFHNKFLHGLNKMWINGLATDFLGCSQEALKWGFSHSKALIKSRVIPNGINLKKFKFDSRKRYDIRKELNIEKETVIGHIGSFNPIKNHLFLLEIFKSYQRLNPNSVLILVGDGNLEFSIKQKINELALNDKVKILGRREDVENIYQAMDIFVFPSLHEGLGFVLIEAQANGLPALASTGVPPEVVLSDNVARYPLGKSADDWALKIAELVEIDRNQTTFNNRMEKFSIINTVKILNSIYISE